MESWISFLDRDPCVNSRNGHWSTRTLIGTQVITSGVKRATLRLSGMVHSLYAIRCITRVTSRPSMTQATWKELAYSCLFARKTAGKKEESSRFLTNLWINEFKLAEKNAGRFYFEGRSNRQSFWEQTHQTSSSVFNVTSPSNANLWDTEIAKRWVFGNTTFLQCNKHLLKMFVTTVGTFSFTTTACILAQINDPWTSSDVLEESFGMLVNSCEQGQQIENGW